MAITIFKDKDCQGNSKSVTADLRDLKGDPADKPSSIRMTDVRDAVLLFKNDDWHGGALYLRGVNTVGDLGSAKDGGRLGFGNSVRSIRLTPFVLDLNISVVKSGTDYPALWPNTWWAEGVVKDVVTKVNNYYMAQNALLALNIARITFRDDPKSFDLSGVESWAFPGDWKEPGEVDFVVINKWDKPGKMGLGKSPCFGSTVTIAAVGVDCGVQFNATNEFMATALAHEMGHYLGLGHGTANDDASNLMFPTGDPAALLSSYSLTVDQLREMQDRLANNLARKGDRNV